MAQASRVERPSSSNSNASSEFPTGESSSTFTTNSNAPSTYYSTRIQSMIENRSNFNSEVEFDTEYSKDHWSELADSDTDNAATRLANREHFEELKKHPQWGGFFKSVKVVVGQKINEGGQAEIFDAKVEFQDGRKSPGYGYHVVKVMKGDNPLQDFQRQWPVGMLCNVSKDKVKGPLMWIEGGTLISNKFAFVMLKQWGDLRRLIDLKKELSNKDPPFENVWFIKKAMLCIARDMDTLHREYGIIHRDLKASNVLLWSFGEELPDKDTHVKANVVDYECSMAVVGTGFWRAPEILQQLKNRISVSELVFTNMTDVYSYGMTCYEILTGFIPFEGHRTRDYDFVLNGNRPKLPYRFKPSFGRVSNVLEIWNRFEYNHIIEIIERCWDHEPLRRPTFFEIVNMLEVQKGKTEEELLFLANLLDSTWGSSLSEMVRILKGEKSRIKSTIHVLEMRMEFLSSDSLSRSVLEREKAESEVKLRLVEGSLETERARRDGVRYYSSRA